MWPLAKDSWGDEEWAAIAALRQAGRITIGPEVDAFEQEFARWHQRYMAVACNSGSSANLLAIAAIANSDQRRGRWLVPAIGWATTYSPLHQYGYGMVVVDVDGTLGIDVEACRRALQEHQDIVGIMAVNVLGVPADLPALRALADKFGLWFVEDNCESLGASVDGQYCGTWGDVGTFSFFFSHTMHTGEGGMVLAGNPHLYASCRSLRSHGWTRGVPGFADGAKGDPRYNPFSFVLPGYNLRMMDLQAAPGRVQLRRLREMIAWRRSNRREAMKFLSPDKFGYQAVRGEIAPMTLPLLYKGDDFKAFLKRLDDAGVEHRPVVAGNILNQKVIDKYDVKVYDTPNADLWHQRGFYVGLWGEQMSDKLFMKLGALA